MTNEIEEIVKMFANNILEEVDNKYTVVNNGGSDDFSISYDSDLDIESILYEFAEELGIKFKPKNALEKIKEILRIHYRQSFSVSALSNRSKYTLTTVYQAVNILYKDGLITRRKNTKKPYNLLYKWKKSN